MTKARIATVAITLLSSLALAQKETAPPSGAAMPMPKPAPELDALKPLAGSWSCEGHSPALSGMPAHDFKATMTNKWDLGNFWMWSTYQGKPDKVLPKGFTGKGWMGYDSSQKKLVWAGVSNAGGWISLRSDGWQGDKLTWTGEDMGRLGKQHATFVFTKGKTPSEWTVTVSAIDATGKSMELSTQSCKKVGKATSS